MTNLKPLSTNLNMKLTVQHVRVRSTDELDSLIEEGILALQPRLRIEEAKIRLACHHEKSPAYSVNVHLVTPGPDIVAESRDHTLPAAIRKAIMELETRIGGRALKRRRRIRSNLQRPAVSRLNRDSGRMATRARSGALAG